MFDKVEVLRAGTFKDNAGNEHTFTEEELAGIAASYDPAKHEAPIVIGHPADNAPAFGWVKRAFTEGKSLFLELAGLVPEFVEACKRGLYKKRSISLYPDRTIRHVGFLGATPPSIKGLKDIQFSDKNQICIEFTDSTEGEVMPKDLAEALVMIGALNADITKLQSQIASFSEENKNLKTENGSLKTQAADFSEKAKEAATQITDLTGKVQGLQKTIADQATDSRKKEHAAFCEKLVSDGKLLPKNRDVTIETLETMHQASIGNFAEGQSPLAKYKKMLEESPRVIEFGESKNKGGASLKGTAGEKLNQLVQKKITENKNMSFSEAARQVAEENAELSAEFAEESRPK
jgi:regulator of replication initiation timing